jgi:hypothetical protein
MAQDHLDCDATWSAANMPAEAPSIQLKRPHETTPQQPSRRENGILFSSH